MKGIIRPVGRLPGTTVIEFASSRSVRIT